LDHERSGELVAIAAPDAWFTYYYWLEESRAPDFAHTVDIHRKPGYDPAELFLDPALKLPKLKIGATLAKRKLGFRGLLEVISTDARLVKGSHGRTPTSPDEGGMLMTKRNEVLSSSHVGATGVVHQRLAHLGSAEHGRRNTQ